MIFSIIVKGSALPQLTVTMIWELPEKFRKSKLKPSGKVLQTLPGPLNFNLILCIQRQNRQHRDY